MPAGFPKKCPKNWGEIAGLPIQHPPAKTLMKPYIPTLARVLKIV